MSTTPRPELKNPVHLLAFGFGVGLSRRAPGTLGSALGLALFIPLSTLPLIHYCLLLVILLLGGVWLCGRTARDLGIHDHGGIVFDEIVGMLIALTALPLDWLWVVSGFALFRFFDIVKPWPISWLDRKVGGGMGIMLDDVVAGIFTLGLLQLGLHLL